MSPLVQRGDAAAYALGALDEAECRAFERWIARDPTLGRDVAAWREVTAHLAHVAPTVEPDRALRARVLDLADAG